MSDLRYALRQLARAPGFTAVALLTLAVGIGSATVVFSALNALHFKPLPLLAVPEDRLVAATELNRNSGDVLGWSYPDYQAVRQRSTKLAGIWIHQERTVIIAGTETPQRLLGTEMSWDTFALMGVEPIQGRGFTADDARAEGEGVALISAALWRKRFDASPDVVGTTVTLNGEPTTIIGVMPPGWRYPDFTDVWTPVRLPPEKQELRGDFVYNGRARLEPGVTLAEAQAEMDGILSSLEREFPKTNAGIAAQLRPIRQDAIEHTTDFTLLLFGAVLFVFLIACVNVANLLLARAVTRAREFAIRLALGAGRRRLVRQLITESVVLALLGGVGGLVLALWGNDAMVAALPIDIPFWLRFDFDARVFGFVLVLSVAGSVIFGLAPALKASRPDVVMELKEGSRTGDAVGPRATRLRSALVVVQVALALVLLVGAGLMMRSFLEVRAIDPGFDPRGIHTFRTGFPATMIGESMERPTRFFDELLAKIRAVPGVETAGLMSWRPAANDTGQVRALSLDREPPPARLTEAHPVHRRVVTSEYFDALRIPLRAGRKFDDALDGPAAPHVAMVDEAFARGKFGRIEDAIGRELRWFEDPEAKVMADKKPEAPLRIVGVVGDIRHRLDRPDRHPTVYVSARQMPENFQTVVVRLSTAGSMSVAGDGGGTTFEEVARDAVFSVNREIPIYEEGALESALLRSQTVWPRRFFGWLFAVFGGVAVFLACIGIYGVMAYNVTQRTHELGVRMALGAQAGEVRRSVLRRGMRLVGGGLACGFVAAFFGAELLAGSLYGISPRDPPTFVAVPVLLATVALVACYIPSRRATSIDPATALRAE